MLSFSNVLLCLLIFYKIAITLTLTQSGAVEEIPGIISEPPSTMCPCSDLETCAHTCNDGQDQMSTRSHNIFQAVNYNTTSHTSTNTTQPMASNLVLIVLWKFTVIVYPIIGVIGISANILSFIIILHSGFEKLSNIFLLGLAVADSFCLLGAVNVPRIIRFVPPGLPSGKFLWVYSRSSAYACFAVAVTCQCMYAYGSYVSAALCTVITLERLIAVYLPLQFTNIVTPTRAWLVSFVVFLMWLPYLVYAGIHWYTFVYEEDLDFKIYSGDMVFNLTELVISLDYYLGAILGKFIPLAIVITGSVLIAIKVTITLRRRKMMVSTSSKSSGSRTTTTLLMVCFIFSVTKIVTLPTYFMDLSDPYSYTAVVASMLGITIFFFECINSSSNFFIYVFFNKKFRLVLVDLLCRRKPSRN